jgi:hypothetical protein
MVRVTHDADHFSLSKKQNSPIENPAFHRKRSKMFFQISTGSAASLEF